MAQDAQSFEIRLATAADAPDVGIMVDAMDSHYRGASGTPGVDAATGMARRTIAEEEGTRFLLGYAGGRIAGLACFAVLRPGVRHTGLLFVKDLFVREASRGRGLGDAMMRWLAAYSRDNGIGRIDLYTGADNAAAQRFYARLGGGREEAIKYRFEADVLAALAAAS
jgi:ribosomal protein S18 acetylase RimI-like enzyme